MKLKEANNILVIGAGLVGSLLSIFLAKRGFSVTLIEKRRDMRKGENLAGRSINLALSNRGWRALEKVGLAESVKKLAIPMNGRMIHDEKGNLSFQKYGKEGEAIYSVSRGGLNWLLLNKAESEGVRIKFNLDCSAVDFGKNEVMFSNSLTKKNENISADAIIGADGAFSAVRENIMKSGRFNYEQFYLEHGYKELAIEATITDDFAMEPNALHIWPRGKFMLIALPNLDKSFTCTLFFPFKGEISFDSLTSSQEVEKFFQKTFPDALNLMPDLSKYFFENPTSSLVTIKCFPWVKNNCMLIGDASHAIVPFYGQGMNAGFEDCFLFDSMLDNTHQTWQSLFHEFQSSRKKDTDAIADLAINNFIEMRDKVADDKFLLRKKIERELNERFPDRWIPLYSMVTFTDIGYASALKRGKEQEAIMDKVMSDPEIDGNWAMLDYDRIINQLS